MNIAKGQIVMVSTGEYSTHADLSEAARLDAASDAEPDLCAGVAASVATANDHKRRPQNWREIQDLKDEVSSLEITLALVRCETGELVRRNLRQARTIFEQADIIARRWKWLVFVGVVAWLLGALMGRAIA